MNYHKAWKKRKKAELLRLVRLYNEQMVQADSEAFPQNIITAAAAGVFVHQFHRVMAQSFKRPRGEKLCHHHLTS